MATDTSVGLRLGGFGVAVWGGFLAAWGSLLTWATVGFRAGDLRPLDTDIKGVDTWEGLVTLVSGVAVVLAVMATRFLRARGAKTLAVAALAAGLAAAIVSGVTLARAGERFADPGLKELASGISERSGLPQDDALRRLLQSYRQLVEVRTGPGIEVSLAGGVLGAAGGALVLLWASRRDERTEPGEADEQA